MNNLPEKWVSSCYFYVVLLKMIHHKVHLFKVLQFKALWNNYMTEFRLLSYTSTCEIPTLLYTWSLKKVPLLGGAYPYRLL